MLTITTVQCAVRNIISICWNIIKNNFYPTICWLFLVFTFLQKSSEICLYYFSQVKINLTYEYYMLQYYTIFVLSELFLHMCHINISAFISCYKYTVIEIIQYYSERYQMRFIDDDNITQYNKVKNKVNMSDHK